MNNPYRGEAGFVAAGRAWTVLLDFEALATQAEALPGVMDAGLTIETMGQLYAALRVGLARHHPDLSLAVVADLVAEIGAAQAMRVLSDALSTGAPPAAEPDADAPPPKPWDWDEQCINWVGLNLPAEAFWKQTPRTWRQTVDGAVRRIERQRLDLRAWSWLSVRLSRTKDLPSLKDFLDPPSAAQPQSMAEQQALIRAAIVAAGGKVVRLKPKRRRKPKGQAHA